MQQAAPPGDAADGGGSIPSFKDVAHLFPKQEQQQQQQQQQQPPPEDDYANDDMQTLMMKLDSIKKQRDEIQKKYNVYRQKEEAAHKQTLEKDKQEIAEIIKAQFQEAKTLINDSDELKKMYSAPLEKEEALTVSNFNSLLGNMNSESFKDMTPEDRSNQFTNWVKQLAGPMAVRVAASAVRKRQHDAIEQAKKTILDQSAANNGGGSYSYSTSAPAPPNNQLTSYQPQQQQQRQQQQQQAANQTVVFDVFSKSLENSTKKFRGVAPADYPNFD
jgi:hypothetical protein